MACAGVDESRLDFDLAPVLALVLAIPGVASARAFAYRMIVQKSPLFEWDEIEQHMLALLLGVRLALEETRALEEARRG